MLISKYFLNPNVKFDDGTRVIDSPPSKIDYLTMRFSVLSWSKKTFADLHINIDPTSLTDLKQNALKLLSSDQLRIHKSPNVWKIFDKQDSFELQVDIVQNLWTVAAMLKDNPQLALSGRSISTLPNSIIFGFKDDLSRFFSQTNIRKFSEKRLRIIMESLYDIIESETFNPQMIGKTFNSRDLIEATVAIATSIGVFMKDQGMSFVKAFDPSKDRDRNFKTEYAKAYNVMIGLGMFLGIDPLFLATLDDKIFSTSAAGKRFQRHEPWELTLDPFRHILTDSSGHITWRGLTGTQSDTVEELYISLLNQAFKTKGELSQTALLELFKDVYAGQDWIVNRFRDNWRTSNTLWYQDKGTLTKINALRKKINYIKEGHSLVEFTEKFNSIAYNRFYINDIDKYSSKIYWLIQKIHNPHKDQATILNEFLSVDFGDLYNELLFDHGYTWWRNDNP